VEIFEGEKFLGQISFSTHIYFFDLVTPTETHSMFSLDWGTSLKRSYPYGKVSSNTIENFAWRHFY
jgi:hypothetical protein